MTTVKYNNINSFKNYTNLHSFCCISLKFGKLGAIMNLEPNDFQQLQKKNDHEEANNSFKTQFPMLVKIN